MSFDTAQDLSALKPYLVQTEPNVLSSCLHPLFIESSVAQENVLIEQHTNEYRWGGENITLKSIHTLWTLFPIHIKTTQVPFFSLYFFITHSHYLYFSLFFPCHYRFIQNVAIIGLLMLPPTVQAEFVWGSLSINCTLATTDFFFTLVITVM